jgi:hypothetical protein
MASADDEERDGQTKADANHPPPALVRIDSEDPAEAKTAAMTANQGAPSTGNAPV